MEVRLSAESEELVQRKVQSGLYGSPSEVIGEALRLLDQRDDLFAFHKDEMRKQIEEGWQPARRGELFDADEVFDRIDAELEALERSAEK